MPLILILALPLALAAAAVTKAAVGAPVRRAARQSERDERDEAQRTADQEARDAAEAERLANLPPTIRSVMERDGLRAAAEFAIHEARSATRARRRDAEPFTDHAAQLRSDYESGPQQIAEAHRSLPRQVTIRILAVLFIVSSTLLYLLERGVLLTVLDQSDLVAVPLALVAVITLAVLGLFIHESIHPTGFIPSWKDKELNQRLPITVALSVLLASFLGVSAWLAPARADLLHHDEVAQADQVCAQARAAAAPAAATTTAAGTGTASSSAQGAASAAAAGAAPAAAAPSDANSIAACARADAAHTTLQRARLWDQTAAVVLPVVEITTAAFALELLVARAARQHRRNLDGAEAQVAALNREIDEIPDLYIDELTTEAVRAGYTADQVEAELAAMGIQPRPAPEGPTEPPPQVGGQGQGQGTGEPAGPPPADGPAPGPGPADGPAPGPALPPDAGPVLPPLGGLAPPDVRPPAGDDAGPLGGDDPRGGAGGDIRPDPPQTPDAGLPSVI